MADSDDIVQKALRLIQGGLSKVKPKGITVADVLRVFPGAKVIPPSVEDLTKPKECKHCAGNQYAKIVKRTYPSDDWHWMCHRCGRTVKTEDGGSHTV
jgi:hypothetical protein